MFKLKTKKLLFIITTSVLLATTIVSQAEQSKMKYFNIPVVSSAPRHEQAEEFIRLVKDPANHPMLINCASANRVGAFMMIYRVLEQGWSENKALEEAAKIGLSNEGLKK